MSHGTQFSSWSQEGCRGGYSGMLVDEEEDKGDAPDGA